MKLLARLILIFIICIGFSSFAQKKSKSNKSAYSYVLTTENISEIEAFLSTSHADDPRRMLCKRRLVQLKNKNWMHNGPVKLMPARPIVSAITTLPETASEIAEFQILRKKNIANHSTKTVNLLNTLFNPDLKRAERIVLVQNKSDCNIIVKFKGHETLSLAVISHGEDFILLKKGTYSLNADVCGTAYRSTKNFQNNQILTLNSPVIIGRVESKNKNY